jgi:HEPN domain-containing protein
MSLEKDKYEAMRWLGTAKEDLDASRALLEKQKYSHACFFAQQCGEKAVKALWLGLGEDPWGHSIQKLISEIPDNRIRSRMEKLLEEGSTLDRYYIPTRYPNGLPDLTPGKVYFQKDADICLNTAHRILEEAEIILETI